MLSLKVFTGMTNGNQMHSTLLAFAYDARYGLYRGRKKIYTKPISWVYYVIFNDLLPRHFELSQPCNL